jgi:RNA polymerase sigma factor (sigma-70 family)
MDTCSQESELHAGSTAVAAGSLRPGTQQEQLLLTAMGRGDSAAFWELWALHREHLYSICARAMGGNHAEAEDALSQAMLKARHEMTVRAEKIDAPRAWLTRLTRNLCIDIRRDLGRRAKAAEQFEGWIERGGWPAPAGGDSSDRALVAEESEAEIRCRVNRLPPELREPFGLKYFRERSCDEIATQLGLSPASVRKRLQLARESLRANWGRSLHGDEPTAPVQSRLVSSQAGVLSPRRESWEITLPTAVVRLAPVRLPCGVERYFRIFLARPPSRERQKIQALRAYLQRHPGSRKRLQELAQLLYRTGAWPEAIRACRQALAKQPFWLSGALLLGEILLLMGNRDEAAAMYTQAVSQTRQSASRRHLSGLVAGCRSDWQEAVKCFEEAAREEEKNPVHLHELARAQLQAGFPEAALRALDDALRLNSNDMVALSGRHAALLAAGREGGAGQSIERALVAAPNDALALTGIAENPCCMAAATPELLAQYRRLLRLALRQAPHSPTVLAALAAHCFSRGDRERGLALTQRLRQLHPGCPRICQQCRSLLSSAGAKLPAEAADIEARPCPGACRLAGIRAGL